LTDACASDEIDSQISAAAMIIHLHFFYETYAANRILNKSIVRYIICYET